MQTMEQTGQVVEIQTAHGIRRFLFKRRKPDGGPDKPIEKHAERQAVPKMFATGS
jgi:hypothetical protein